jgi:HAD superfamily hydrolase (TIGR01509 family)
LKVEDYKDIELIIFDCDGVLIDSETISAQVISKQFRKIGIDINTKYVQNNFVGNSYPKVKEHIFKKFNIILADNFEDDYRRELLLTFKEELHATIGISDLLNNLSIKKCVATSSSLLRATTSLDIVGLLKYFNNNIYSAYNLANKGKPAPDIYLLAAKKFNVDVNNILVIEDSLLGIQGAKNANMKVWHYTGASHLRNWDYSHKYNYKPDFVFNNMNDFYKYLPHLKNKKED